MIEGAVKFYLGFLFPYGEYYVTGPSTSPENRFCGEDGKSHSVGMASTMDISILKELFGYYLKICNTLGIEGETADVKRVLSKLPPFKTGSFGQIREWFLDYPETEIHHRHVSHLYGLYPGNLIIEKNSELLEACRVALERRGDEGTGWVYGMEGLPLGQTPGRGTCTGAFEKPAPLYQGGKYLLCGRRHLSQHVVCTPSVPDRWEFWLCSCSCRDAYPEQERAFPVASGTSG